MSRIVDLSGKRFGNLVVLRRTDDYVSPSGNHAVRWSCQCDCGKILDVKTNALLAGKTTSCGCGRLNSLIKEAVGKKYGKLTCIEYSHMEHGVGYFFKFRCDCGNEVLCCLSKVRNGYVNSCGCLQKEKARQAVFRDLTGQKFNHLTVIKYVGRKNKKTIWHCVCDCGNEKDVDSNSLISGNTKACGCHQYDGLEKRRTHGKSKTRLYRIWSNMKSRCYYPNAKYFENYGGRGIRVCDEWINDFVKFYEWAMENGYSDNLTIDRIDNDGNYSPTNCQWVTRSTQMNNVRNNRIIEYNGKEQTLAEWAVELEMPYYILNGRINSLNWDINRAFETPIMKRGGNHKSNCVRQ